MNTETVPASPLPAAAPPANARDQVRTAARAAAFLLLQWPLHLFFFVMVVVLLAVGVGTVIIWVGLGLLLAGLWTARGAAQLQRAYNRGVHGLLPPPDLYPPLDGPGGNRLWRALRRRQPWRDAAWVLVTFPLATVTWVLAVLWVSVPLGALATPVLELLELIFPHQVRNGLAEAFGLPYDVWLDLTISTVLGVIFLLTMPRVLPALELAHVRLSDLMLCRAARQEENITHLTRSRQAARQAETRELRRLERDLHDGPQQRLVRLQMDLARAQRRLTQEPDQASALLTDALEQTRQTLAELRQLSRGIAPPVLVDRGLLAALSEATARSVVPVQLQGTIPPLPEHVEVAAYFVVSEALANVNKHAAASRAVVNLTVTDAQLLITVDDDGQGGAALAKGFGLAGLAERLRAVDGQLTIFSPTGGPTRIQAVIPCAS
ncbi:sensor histidine kinase [Buchananella hordeovulneris]|uniref:sensor histidine kinase n=1 Tax=Buchananella hordeovulneris TaxID=52770 RepID=UPI000F5EBCFA|nr:sensor histidine kinase [Buchananella hordeovulneris]RRD43795.1 sensor histidine kinase [Buchananella hordeovulneris]RRD50675.1 sensor histidine kinase [Buchananella hordeovulneris]